MDLMRQGMSRGITAAPVFVESLVTVWRTTAAADPLSTPYLSAFKDFGSSSIAPELQKVLLNQALEIYGGQIVPAYADWIQFLDKTYLPTAQKARAVPGMSALPNGAAW